jgi:hypothetical protein
MTLSTNKSRLPNTGFQAFRKAGWLEGGLLTQRRQDAKGGLFFGRERAQRSENSQEPSMG